MNENGQDFFSFNAVPIVIRYVLPGELSIPFFLYL